MMVGGYIPTIRIFKTGEQICGTYSPLNDFDKGLMELTSHEVEVPEEYRKVE